MQKPKPRSAKAKTCTTSKAPEKSAFVQAVERLNKEHGATWGFKIKALRDTADQVPGGGRVFDVTLGVEVWLDQNLPTRFGTAGAEATLHGDAMRLAFESAFVRAAALWGLADYDSAALAEPPSAEEQVRTPVLPFRRPQKIEAPPAPMTEAQRMAAEDGRPPAAIGIPSGIKPYQVGQIKQLAQACGKDATAWLATPRSEAEGDTMINQLQMLLGPGGA